MKHQTAQCVEVIEERSRWNLASERGEGGTDLPPIHVVPLPRADDNRVVQRITSETADRARLEVLNDRVGVEILPYIARSGYDEIVIVAIDGGIGPLQSEIGGMAEIAW